MAQVFDQYPLQPLPDDGTSVATAASLEETDNGVDGSKWVTPYTLATTTLVSHPSDLAAEAAARAAGYTILLNDPRTVHAYENYAAMAAAAVDAVIEGKTPSAATQNFFSTYDTVNRVFVRNPSCIFAWPSFVSCWNSANADGTGGNRGCVTMVTPTQGITNNHFAQPYAPGVLHDFLGTDGEKYTLEVASSDQVGTTDIQIVTFTTSASAAVGVAQFFQAGQPAQLLPAGTPLLSFNQDKRAVITELETASSAIYLRTATGDRASWSAGPPPFSVGDSDQPTFAVTNLGLILLCTLEAIDGFQLYGFGPSLSENISAINAALDIGTLSIAPLNALPITTGATLAGNNTFTGANAFAGILSQTDGNWDIQPTGAFSFAGSGISGTAAGDFSANTISGQISSQQPNAIFFSNSAGTMSGLTLGAGQSIRRKADNTAFEAYTPANAVFAFSGLVYSPSINGAPAAATVANVISLLSGGTGTFNLSGYTLGLLASQIPAIAESGVTGLVSDLAAKAPLASPTFTGTASAASFNNTTATNPAYSWGSTLYATRTAAGTMALGTTQGGTDGTLLCAATTTKAFYGQASNGDTRVFLNANDGSGSGAISLSRLLGLGWFSANSFSGTIDTAFRSPAANTVALGNGTSGNASGTLQLGILTASAPCKLGGYTVGTLPTASTNAGNLTTVSNPASGKSNLVYSNGSNWLYTDGTTAA